MDKKIDFLIIGAQKAGTTSLYDYLAQHPDIFLPETKEIHYFARDEFYRKGEAYLAPFYKKYAGEHTVGGAYVHLMYFPYVAQRIYDYNPHMHVIAVLRNPIDRAYSSYWYACRNGWESICHFEDALAAEDKRLHGTYQEQAELTYLTHGHYAEQLRPYIELFGKDHVHPVLSDHLRQNPEGEIGRILDKIYFARGGTQHTALNTSFESNQAGMPKNAKLHRWLLSVDGPHKKIVRALTPQSFRLWVSRHITMPFLQRNIAPFTYPPMEEATRARLRHYFAPHNQQLAEMFSLSLDHWT